MLDLLALASLAVVLVTLAWLLRVVGEVRTAVIQKTPNDLTPGIESREKASFEALEGISGLVPAGTTLLVEARDGATLDELVRIKKQLEAVLPAFTRVAVLAGASVRGVAGPGVEQRTLFTGPHAYLSTACLHDRHDQCRRYCKWCHAFCGCAHHERDNSV